MSKSVHSYQATIMSETPPKNEKLSQDIQIGGIRISIRPGSGDSRYIISDENGQVTEIPRQEFEVARRMLTNLLNARLEIEGGTGSFLTCENTAIILVIRAALFPSDENGRIANLAIKGGNRLARNIRTDLRERSTNDDHWSHQEGAIVFLEPNPSNKVPKIKINNTATASSPRWTVTRAQTPTTQTAPQSAQANQGAGAMQPVSNEAAKKGKDLNQVRLLQHILRPHSARNFIWPLPPRPERREDDVIVDFIDRHRRQLERHRNLVRARVLGDRPDLMRILDIGDRQILGPPVPQRKGTRFLTHLRTKLLDIWNRVERSLWRTLIIKAIYSAFLLPELDFINEEEMMNQAENIFLAIFDDSEEAIERAGSSAEELILAIREQFAVLNSGSQLNKLMFRDYDQYIKEKFPKAMEQEPAFKEATPGTKRKHDEEVSQNSPESTPKKIKGRLEEENDLDGEEHQARDESFYEHFDKFGSTCKKSKDTKRPAKSSKKKIPLAEPSTSSGASSNPTLALPKANSADFPNKATAGSPGPESGGPDQIKVEMKKEDSDEGFGDICDRVQGIFSRNYPHKILEARHGKESAWVHCKLKTKSRELENLLVSFPSVNEFDRMKTLRIFTRLNHINKTEVVVQNVGPLKIELSLECYLWDRRVDETQSIGVMMKKLEKEESHILTAFSEGDMRVNAGTFQEGINLRIHFKPHY